MVLVFTPLAHALKALKSSHGQWLMIPYSGILGKHGANPGFMPPYRGLDPLSTAQPPPGASGSHSYLYTLQALNSGT
jgi:hypothetical protein